jgi:hypothetical protein
MFLCAFINGTKTDVHVVFCIMVGWFPRTIGNLCNMPTFDDLIGVQVDSCILIFLRPLTVNIQISYAVNQDCIKLVLILAKYNGPLCNFPFLLEVDILSKCYIDLFSDG